MVGTSERELLTMATSNIRRANASLIAVSRILQGVDDPTGEISRLLDEINSGQMLAISQLIDANPDSRPQST